MVVHADDISFSVPYGMIIDGTGIRPCGNSLCVTVTPVVGNVIYQAVTISETVRSVEF